MQHLRENNETYLSHFIFASKIALHLYVTSFCLVVHAIIPFWDVPKNFDLTKTYKKILEWYAYAEQRRQK
jgi:hypothetical protein